MRETREDWEQVRRSVAMLPTGAWAMRREQALEVLGALIARLRTGGDQSTGSIR